MTHRVVMIDPALSRAPSKIREEARLRFQEIAEGLEGIPSDNAFWVSAKVSRLCLVVRGWSFSYTIDEDTLRVIDVRRS
ncbi:MAG: hypothetical protein ACXVH7_13335 [Thermoanaerobaculia bacterium]